MGADSASDDATTRGGEADARVVPRRHGSREERREVTLAALGSGREAFCAYCGHRLPPVPPTGGRPTPYCPAEADRYGRWGAKIITCAMLDEHREIWVTVYGPAQPMTTLDTHTLDQRADDLTGVVRPLLSELAALRTRAGEELRAALHTAAEAEKASEQAVKDARAANDEKLLALEDSRQARQAATEAAAAASVDQIRAARAATERDTAIAERDLAVTDRDTARSDQQAALNSLTEAHRSITDLQNTLAAERAGVLDTLQRTRREADTARDRLRLELETTHRQRVAELTDRLDAQRVDTDRRVAELSHQLTTATNTYATTLAPLHQRITTLERQLSDQQAHAQTADERLTRLHTTLEGLLADDTEEHLLRERLLAVLGDMSLGEHRDSG